MTSKDHLERLAGIIEAQITEVRELPESNIVSTSDGGWGPAQCLHHMVRVYELYKPRIESAIHNGVKATGNDEFASSWFGRKSIQDTRPGNDKKIKMKMKTFGFFKPDPSVTFDGAKAQLIECLTWHKSQIEKASNVDLKKNKVRSAIRFISFRLGDAMEFILAHNERHLLQAARAYSK
jgi:hypothetical protein